MKFDESAYLDSEEDLELIENFIREMDEGRGVLASYDEDTLIFLFDHFISEDNHLRCEQILQIAELQHPSSTDMMDCQARLQASKGNLKEAFDIINNALSLDENNVDLLLTKGKLLLNMNKNAEADAIFQQLNDPEDPFLYGTLVDIGVAYRNMNHEDSAIYYLTQAAQLENNKGNNEEALYELGLTYEHIDDWENAEKCFEKVLDFNPYSKQTWRALGYLHYFSGNYKKSAEAFDYAYTIDPQDTSCIWLKANSLFSDMNFKEAIPLYEEYSDLTGETAECCNSIAECYMSLEEYEQAREMLERALRLEPDNPNTKYCLSELAMFMRDADEAEKWCDQLLDQDPTMSEYHRMKATILFLKEQHEEGIKFLEKALELNPNNKQALLSFATEYFERGEYEKALIHLQKAEQIDDKMENLYLLFAMVSYAMDDLISFRTYIPKIQDWEEKAKAFFLNIFPEAKEDLSIQDLF